MSKKNQYFCPKSHKLVYNKRIIYGRYSEPFTIYYCLECDKKYVIDNRLVVGEKISDSSKNPIINIRPWEHLAGPEIPSCIQISPFHYSTYNLPLNIIAVNEIPPVCYKCGGVLCSFIYHIITKKLKFDICIDCYTAYSLYPYIKDHFKLIRSRAKSIEANAQFLKELGYCTSDQNPQHKKSSHNKIGSDNYIPYNNQQIFVYVKLNNSCVQHHQEYLESLTLRTSDSIKKYVDYNVNVYHCKLCDKHFINAEVVDGFIKSDQHPSIRYNFIVPEHYRKQYSELRLLGYNVRQGDLTDLQRTNLLSWIISNNLLSKTQIIKQLQDNINYCGQKSGMENAIQKWHDDIIFVSTYTIDNNTCI